MRQHSLAHRIAEVTDAYVRTLLRQGNLAAAARLAQGQGLPGSQARIYLAQGDASAALAVLDPWRAQMEAKGWVDERLKALVLQALAHHARGEKDTALQLLGDALALAEPGGSIRTFVDEGPPMAGLLSEAAAHGIMPGYAGKLLAGFQSSAPTARALVEQLSQRELEVLQLVAQGLSNQEIGERLFLALSTVKGHIQKIFDKLQVQRRTEAVARARELRLL